MSFNCCLFIDVAEDILTSPTGTDQEYLRTLVGRTYYGPYGHLRTLICQQVGDCFGTLGLHWALCDVCLNSSNPHISRIGKRLQILYGLRIRGDYEYDISQDIQHSEAETAIDTSRSVASKIENLQLNDLQAIHYSLINR